MRDIKRRFSSNLQISDIIVIHITWSNFQGYIIVAIFEARNSAAQWLQIKASKRVSKVAVTTQTIVIGHRPFSIQPTGAEFLIYFFTKRLFCF